MKMNFIDDIFEQYEIPLVFTSFKAETHQELYLFKVA